MGCTVSTVTGDTSRSPSKHRKVAMDEVNTRIFAKEARAAFEIEEGEKPECPEAGVIVKVRVFPYFIVVHAHEHVHLHVFVQGYVLFLLRLHVQASVTATCTYGRAESK